MTNEQGDFHSFFNNCTSQNIVVGNGYSIPVLGQGTKYLPKPFPPFVLKNILYAPKLLKNLISVRRFITHNSVSVEFDPFGFLVKDYKTRTPILRCNSSGDLYPLVLGSGSSQPSAFAAISSQIWHQRLGHPGQSPLHSLRNSGSIDYNKSMNNVCESCVLGKSIRLPFPTSTSCTSQPFDIIHSDLWTSPIVSSGGHRYYILFLDDLTNFLWTFPISKRSQVFSGFSNFAQHIKTQFERTIKTFQCDNGKEYVNASFQNFFAQNGMVFRLSCPHTSSQNGKAERKIRTINNMMRTLLAHASLPNTFWHHALDTTTYLLNILPTKSSKHNTPTELLYNSTPSFDHLRVFGCLCYPLTPSTTIHKLEHRSHPCVFLGYPSNHRGYKCFNLETKQIIISRHVASDETTFPFSHTLTPTPSYNFLTHTLSPHYWQHISSSVPPQPANQDPQTSQPSPTHSTTTFPTSPTLSTRPNRHPAQPLISYSRHPRAPPVQPPTSQTYSNDTINNPASSTLAPSDPHITSASIPNQNTQTNPPPPPSRTMHTRSMSGITKPRNSLNLNTSTNTVPIIPVPKNPIQALSIPEWHTAMTNEYNALIKNGTWV